MPTKVLVAINYIRFKTNNIMAPENIARKYMELNKYSPIIISYYIAEPCLTITMSTTIPYVPYIPCTTGCREYNIFYNIFYDKIYNTSIFVIDKRLLLD